MRKFRPELTDDEIKDLTIWDEELMIWVQEYLQGPGKPHTAAQIAQQGSYQNTACVEWVRRVWADYVATPERIAAIARRLEGEPECTTSSRPRAN